ncbi:MAG: hypothetical protein JJE09_04435 [Bacteroidia bacterium]|nr:hypothetical protein [Bacteroidia bacterium]
MFVPFDALPPNARIWIYQSDRPLNSEEEKHLMGSLKAFCEQWKAHGQELKTSFKIERNQFVILAVDENYNDASGCSIDGSVRILKSLQQEGGINFFDRGLVAFQIENEVQTFYLQELKNIFLSGRLTASTLTFDNLVATKSDFDKAWLTTVDKTWLGKYLPKSTVAGG